MSGGHIKIHFWIVGVVYNTDTAMTTIAPVSQTRAKKFLLALHIVVDFAVAADISWLVGGGSGRLNRYK